MSINWIKKYIKRIIYCDEIDFFPKTQWQTLGNVLYVNRLKEDNYMIVLKIVEKEFDKCNSLFSYMCVWEWRKSHIK